MAAIFLAYNITNQSIVYHLDPLNILKIINDLLCDLSYALSSKHLLDKASCAFSFGLHTK
jgi:hypothetical protein